MYLLGYDNVDCSISRRQSETLKGGLLFLVLEDDDGDNGYIVGLMALKPQVRFLSSKPRTSSNSSPKFSSRDYNFNSHPKLRKRQEG